MESSNKHFRRKSSIVSLKYIFFSSCCHTIWNDYAFLRSKRHLQTTTKRILKFDRKPWFLLDLLLYYFYFVSSVIIYHIVNNKKGRRDKYIFLISKMSRRFLVIRVFFISRHMTQAVNKETSAGAGALFIEQWVSNMTLTETSQINETSLSQLVSVFPLKARPCH